MSTLRMLASSQALAAGGLTIVHHFLISQLYATVVSPVVCLQLLE